MSDPTPVTVVNVICTSYSGNTWLNMMLGTHSRMFCIGELKSMYKSGKPVCILHGDTCPVWSRYDQDSGEHPYRQVADLTGFRMLVVSNSWKYVQTDGQPGMTAKFIHLLRDGRAVAASFLRKHEGLSMSKAARRWVHDYRRNEALLASRPAGEVFTVRYEDLRTDPETNLRAVCEFLGLDFEPGMLSYWQHDHHYLGGNRGTLFALARKRGEELPEDERPEQAREPRDWHLEYYEKSNVERFVDDRWKQELSGAQLTAFALFAGRLNRRLGYPPVFER